MSSKKASGFQNRKRKALRDQELEKQKDRLLKFFKSNPDSSDTSDLDKFVKQPDVQQNLFDHATEGISKKEENISKECVSESSMIRGECSHKIESSTTIDSLDYNDPGNWPDFCDDSFRMILVQNSPHQVIKHNFPKDSNNRRFSPTHYTRKLSNGEEVNRSWLMYSIKKDAVFCYCCKLFNKNSSSRLEKSGSKDWKNIGAVLSSHERNILHLESFQNWKELDVRISKGTTIDNISLQNIKEEEEYWREILERLIALTRVLATQNLSFRGTNEKLFNKNNGNFLKFVEYLAIFDPVMKEHVRKIKNHHNQEIMVHYLGKDIQNELMQILAGAIRNKILSLVKSAKYYSIILDCTPDVSHVEQMSMIIRFVDVKPLNSEPEVVVREHFLGFVPLDESTGTFIAETLLEKLMEMELRIENLRGQGYDNGSNMKGKEKGVQNRILNINPRAFFIPCNAHSLNLVVNDASKCCLEATNFFNIVQQIYNYFSASTQRWHVFTSHVVGLTVKPLSDTRWESRIDALKPIRYQLGSIYDALMEIYEDARLNNSSGNISRLEAKALANSICKFKFMVSLVTWYNILNEVNVTSKILQKENCTIDCATNQLQVTKNYLLKCRSDNEFEQVLIDAADIAKELETEVKFEPIECRRRHKRQFLYENPDEAPQDPKQKFKVEFYYTILDIAIQSIEERFQQLKQHNILFGFLYDIASINKRTSADILDNCKCLEKSLTYKNNKDIDAHDLFNELQILARRLPRSMSPSDVLIYIVQQHLEDCVPNVVVSLRILLTLPVSVASGERSFSKLKLIKTYLRSTMSQNRLVDLATISIESEFASSLELKPLVDTFARRKARKAKF